MTKFFYKLPSYQAPKPSHFINLHSTPLAYYFNALKANCRNLDNQGLALDEDESTKSGKNVSLESLYVFPAVSEQHIEAESMASMGEEEAKAATSGLSAILRDNPRFILLGDPGIGKSTFIQWLNLAFAYPTKNTAREMLGPLLPLTLTARRLQFIEKLDYKNYSCDYFLDVLITSMGSVAEKLKEEESRTLVVQALKQGQVMLMVDGVDEIPSQQSEWLAESLKLLLERYNHIRLLLTSRIVGFDHLSFWFPLLKKDHNYLTSGKISQEQLVNMDMRVLDDGSLGLANLPPTFFLSPFDNNRRQVYVEHWTNSYLPKKSEAPEFIQSLKSACFKTGYLDALSRNPVLLTMICFIQWRTGTLPNGRAELYRRIVATYLVGLDRARKIDSGYSKENLPYDYEDIQFWIAKLAWLMQCGDLTKTSLTETEREIPFKNLQDRITSITASNLQLFFAAHIASVTGDKDTADNDAEQLIEFIKKRTGFLIPKGLEGNEEIFSFSHLSFQEYFAGYFMTQYWQEWSADEDELSKLQSTLERDTWQEVWQLAFEETKRRRQSAMLEALFDEDTDMLTDSDANLLLAKLLMNTTLRFEPEQKERKLLQCWYVANQKYLGGTLTLIWSNKAILDTVLQPEQCTHISLDHLSQSQLQEFLPRLAEFTLLTSLSLSKQKINDISALARLTKLTRLDLGSAQISDISALAKLTNLDFLTLNDTQVSDISTLAKLTNLEILALSGTHVSDISVLAKLTNLTHLFVYKTQIADISALARLTNLTHLYIYDTHITDISVLLLLDSLQEIALDKSIAEDQPETIQQLKAKSVSVLISPAN